MDIQDLTKLPNIFWRIDKKGMVENIISPPAQFVPQGQFAFVFEDVSSAYLIRDRLGLNKLFYHRDLKGRRLTIANYFFELLEQFGDIENIFSVPAGHWLRIDKESMDGRLTSYYDVNHNVKPNKNFDLKDFQKKTAAGLEDGFKLLAKEYAGYKTFVCLSGGLDSAIIADFASRFLKERAMVVTFSYASDSTIEKFGEVVNDPGEDIFADSLLSDDFKRAFSIAQVCDLPFVAVLIKREMDEKVLDEILKYGQDWRDFNVHCAWVNYHIFSSIKRAFPNEKRLFLTGDLMNEFVADYTPVQYKETTYYPQPRIEKERLRRFFVYGLDAGDREIGICGRQGGVLIQPYSLLAESYFEIPASYLEDIRAKQELNGALLLNQKISKLVSDKKIRSQVGGQDGGTLGLFHDSAITQQFLLNRWQQLILQCTGEPVKSNIIMAGRYRS